MKRFLLLLLCVISISVKAGPEELAQELFEGSPRFPASQGDVQKIVSDGAPGYSELHQSKEMRDVSSMFEENVDAGKKEGDSIRSNLCSRVNEHNRTHQDQNKPEPSISEAKTMLSKKHNDSLPKTDSVFLGHKNVQEGDQVEANSVLENVKSKFDFEGYGTEDFVSSLTHFNALKEMNNELKDGLGGIRGTMANPTVFHGKCYRCTIKGGKVIQDCCNLQGVLKGIIGGGCRESEKLATAVFKEKRCHLVQRKYCTRRIRLGIAKICVEWKEAYCCYGSELARIIQEIAHDDPNQKELRAYNAAHGIYSGWGTGENPNCQSLSSEQISLINFDTPFAQKHLGQLFNGLESQAEAKFKEIERKTNSQEGMKARAERAQESMIEHFSSSFKDRPNSQFRKE